MKNLFLLLSFLLFSAAQAATLPNEGADYALEASGQSYPLGGLLKARGGYGWSFWQARPENEEGRFWKFGYLRPFAEFQTGGILNRGLAGLEIYPISILGFSGGTAISLRNTKRYRDFDCGNVVCNKNLSNQFLQARLILGFSKMALILTGRYEKFYSDVLDRPFYEEMSYLLGKPGGDDLKTLSALLVYQYDETWSGGFLGIYQNFLGSQSNSSSNFGILNHTEGPWRGTVGLGQYKSTHQRADAAVIVSVVYTGIKGIGLFD